MKENYDNSLEERLKEMYKTAGEELADEIRYGVFEGDDYTAVNWYNSENIALGDKSPKESLKDGNYFQVEKVLNGIKNFIIS